MSILNKHKAISLISFLVLSLAVYGICVLYVVNLIQWNDTPDWGFGFRNATGVHVVGEVGDQGAKSGLQIGDRILEVNGKEYDTYLTLNAARIWDIGKANSYLIERKGAELVVEVPNEPLGFKSTFNLSGYPFIAGFCYILIGTIVFLMKPNQRGSWIFICFASVLGLLITFLFKSSVLRPFWLENIIIFVWCFLGATFFHLALSFPEERKILIRLPWIQTTPYAISIIIFVAIRLNATAMLNAPPFWLNILLTYLAAGVLFFIGSCLQLWLRSKSEMAKRRAKMILLGFAIAASLPLLDTVFGTIFGFYLVPGLNYYLPFFIVLPAFIAYSIVKHDLFDFDAIIKRTYGYFLTTGAIAGLYGLFVLISNLVFGQFEITQSRLFPLVFMLAVVFFFNPIRNRAQKIIDKLFYRLEYDYQETVQNISESMRTLLRLDQIGKSIMDTAKETMFIDSGCVMLMDRKSGTYSCLSYTGECTWSEDQLTENTTYQKNPGQKTAGSKRGDQADQGFSSMILTCDEPLIQKLADQKRAITIYDIQENPLYADDMDAYQQAFNRMNAILIIPLIYEERLIGIIALGNKKSGKFYRREDINLLHILANQGAVAIENAIMIEEVIEKERMQEELNIAKNLQVSMLPAECPTVHGFDLAAYSLSAREVGGDFYDFIETKHGKLGLVIGDVTGKSVSGALVMSASRSIFRMLSEEELTVDQIMTRANRRTKKDIKSGMFVALLYAMLDLDKSELRLCSAGQTQPILLSNNQNRSTLIETVGDTFPLGILEEVDYQETVIDLKKGDSVIFYTDGIVEAMNAHEELFGFERLRATVDGAKKLDSESILKLVIDKVEQFAGGTPQHDDITVIVLKAQA